MIPHWHFHRCRVLKAFVRRASLGALMVILTTPALAFKWNWVINNYINTAVGYADRQGSASNWWHSDEPIVVDDDVSLYLRFNFNSHPPYMSDSSLGKGWWIPLLECRFWRRDAATLMMTGPGGYPFRFDPDPKDASAWVSIDARLTAREMPGHVFEVAMPREGWRFRFEGGRLRKATTPKGDELDWIYEGLRVTRITSKALGDLVTARYDDRGLLQRVDLPRNKYWIAFGYTEFPLRKDASGKSPPVASVPSVGSIKDSKGFMQTVSYGLDARQDIQSILLDRLAGMGALRMENVNDYMEPGASERGSIDHLALTWRADSGHILTDSDHRYDVTVPDAAPFAHASTVRTSLGGLIESYAYDWRTGKCVERHTNNTVTTTWYNVKHGVNYAHYMSCVKELAGNDDPLLPPIETIAAGYDEHGRQIWELRNEELRTYTYDDKDGISKDAVKFECVNENGTWEHCYQTHGKINKSVKRYMITTSTYDQVKGKSVLSYELGGIGTNYYDPEGNEVRREDSDGTWSTYEYYKRGLPSKIVNSSGRVYTYRYGPDDEAEEKYTNGHLTYRRVKLPSGKQYALLFLENEEDPFHVHAVEDLASGDILNDDEAEKIIEQIMP